MPHTDLQQITDKYAGVKLCEMNSEELEEFLGGIARRASIDTLRALGMEDEYAVNDIRDLRDILKGFRVIKKNAVATMLNSFGRMVGWMLIIILAGFFLHTSPVIKKSVVDLLAP